LGKTLILIDGHALAFRQYYALERTGMKTSDGTPTWAVFGFFKAVFDLLKNESLQADAIAVAFDVSHQTFRLEKYANYKSNREAMPDPMKIQMELINEGLKAFNIPVYTKEGFEADDVIGTIAQKACDLGHKTLILTGDQDAFQLVDSQGCTKVIIPSKGELMEYNWEKIHEKLGVYPDQVVDYKALRGDTSDCIPGIKGIGEKTAAMLLNRYYTLEELLADCMNIPEKSVKEKICGGKEDAELSKFLATIVKDVDFDFDFDKTHVELPDLASVTQFLKKMQFYSFIKNINSIMHSFNKNEPVKPGVPQEGLQLGFFTETAPQISDVNYDRKVITDAAGLALLVKELESRTLISFKAAADVKSAVLSNLTGIAFAYNEAYQADNRVHAADSKAKTQTFYIEHSGQLLYEDIISALKPVFENENIKKTVHDAKTEYNILRNHGIHVQGIIFDTMLASYVKDPTRNHDLDVQSVELLNHVMYDVQDKKKRDTAPDYVTDHVSTVLELTKYWTGSLDDKELKLLYEIEFPLSLVLADMECTGISIDVGYLRELTQSMNRTLHRLEDKIYQIAQEGFNINSPKQVGEILFGKLGLKSRKKRGKQQYSTNAQILEELAPDYEIADLILKYRKFAKLKSTYTEALPALINPVDGRIHTSYNQTVTTTGRLSSSNPNLQNIPVRTEDGNRIRQAFVPKDRKNSLILSADYSQIELRLLAHISQDKHLTDAFNKNIDVHSLTASKVFDVPIEAVTKEMRYKAKAVNFGIIYGQSKYGLAKALGISNEEADDFIRKYFITYPDVKVYMENTVRQVEETGYVETIFGRKRYLADELASSNGMVREFAKRAAINQPLQGTAADLMKIAMINFAKKLKENNLKSKMIMQVHDEIVAELDKSELDVVQRLITSSMELDGLLSVPLVVDISIGATWKNEV
jgi:DNA polymerase-1